MIGLILFGFGFVLGMLHGQGKLIPWVRGAAGKARGVVLGSRPAASTRDNLSPIEVSPTPPKNPIRIGTALKNIVGFFVGVIAWAAKNPVPAIAILVLALWLMAGASCSGPFGFGKSRGELRLERQIAEANTRIAEHEARIGALSGQLAENTARDQRRVSTIIAQANEDIDHAVEAVDPDELYSVYRRAYDGVWHDLSASGGPDPATRGPDRLPGAPADPT